MKSQLPRFTVKFLELKRSLSKMFNFLNVYHTVAIHYSNMHRKRTIEHKMHPIIGNILISLQVHLYWEVTFRMISSHKTTQTILHGRHRCNANARYSLTIYIKNNDFFHVILINFDTNDINTMKHQAQKTINVLQRLHNNFPMVFKTIIYLRQPRQQSN